MIIQPNQYTLMVLFKFFQQIKDIVMIKYFRKLLNRR